MIVCSSADQQRLQALREKLSRQPKYAGKLAEPFFGYAPDTYDGAQKKILYVGKATAGPFRTESLEDKFGCNSKAFWSFARRLSNKTGSTPDTLSNIAWSNLCRIGTISGNPGRALAQIQRPLCVQVLQSEIATLQPNLIVCVAANTIYDDFLYEALKVRRGRDRFIEKRRDRFQAWIRPAFPPHPPILWMRHPQFQRADFLAFAEAEAMQLLESAVP